MRFAKAQEKKMGRPEQIIKKREPQKSPISKIWISMLHHPLRCTMSRKMRIEDKTPNGRIGEAQAQRRQDKWRKRSRS
jgi:hypothetical protein